MPPTLIVDAAGRSGCKTVWSRNPAAWFEDDGPPPHGRDPVIFMVYPTDEAAETIATLGSDTCREFDLPGQPICAERLHLTLHPLCRYGRLTGASLRSLHAEMAALAAPPFLAGFDLVENFGREEGPLVLRGGDDTLVGAAMLRNELVFAARRAGFRCGTRNYTPHITLNYKKCAVPAQLVEEIRWTVRELVLVCSLQGRRLHRVLGRWKLRPPGRLN